MKEYNYDAKKFMMKVTVTGVFCVLIALYSIWQWFLTRETLWAIILLIAVYTVWNSFVTISNPSKVILSDEEIVFSAYGREDRFPMTEITSFRVKDFPNVRKLFIRINNASWLHGRYWIPAAFFNDTDELYRAILDIEERIHPNTLKSAARYSHKKR